MSKQVWFADNHHAGLAYSLRLLVKRLGHEIYFPIGERWFDEGYWKIAKPYKDNPGTIKQYLQIKSEHKPMDGSPVLNSIVGRKSGWYEVEDVYHGDIFRSITFQQFLDTDIDVIIGSIPDHWHAYKQLRNEHKPKAKVVAHMGNMFDEVGLCIADGTIDNLMASTIEFPLFGYSLQTVFYYQEIPLVEYKPPAENRNISSYVHLLPRPEQYNLYKSRLPFFNWKAYGASSPDGWMPSLVKLYESMQNDMFVYHSKPLADGFGWNVHSAAMLGRPLLINYEEYKDKLAGALLIPDKTCISLDSGDGYGKIVEKIQYFSQPGLHKTMCEAMYRQFHELVDYKNEEEKIRRFFENLK